jgi:hypothetical protein
LEILDSRSSESKDFVRIEIAQALRQNVRIIPILIDGAKLPSIDRLPSDLKLLSQRHAITIRADTFRADVDQLIKFLQDFLRPRPDAADAVLRAPTQTASVPRQLTLEDIKRIKSAAFVKVSYSLGGALEARRAIKILRDLGLEVIDNQQLLPWHGQLDVPAGCANIGKVLQQMFSGFVDLAVRESADHKGFSIYI